MCMQSYGRMVWLVDDFPGRIQNVYPPVSLTRSQQAFLELKDAVNMFKDKACVLATHNFALQLVYPRSLSKGKAAMQIIKLLEQCNWELDATQFAKILEERNICISNTKLVEDSAGQLRNAQDQFCTNVRMNPRRVWRNSALDQLGLVAVADANAGAEDAASSTNTRFEDRDHYHGKSLQQS